MKIIKIVVTNCQILTVKCAEFDLCWGSAPDPTGKAHSTPPDPLAGYKRSYFWGRGASKGREQGGGGMEMEGGKGG